MTNTNRPVIRYSLIRETHLSSGRILREQVDAVYDADWADRLAAEMTEQIHAAGDASPDRVVVVSARVQG